MAQLVKKPPAMRETWVQSLGWEDPLEKGKATHSSILAWSVPLWDTWGRGRISTLVFLGFSCGSAGKETTCNVGDLGSIPGLGRSPGEGKGSPLQYSGLENSMDCVVHGVAKSWTQLSDFHIPLLYYWCINSKVQYTQTLSCELSKI